MVMNELDRQIKKAVETKNFSAAAAWQVHRNMINADIIAGVIQEIPKTPQESVYNHPDFTFDQGNQEVVVDKTHIRLTPTEAALMSWFAQRPNILIKHEDLLETAGLYEVVDIRAHLSHLRTKIKNGRENFQNPIQSYYGFGYRLIDSSKPDTPSNNTGVEGLIFAAGQLETDNKEQSRSQQKELVYNHPYFTFDREDGLLIVEGKRVRLTPLEFEILQMLARNSNHVVHYNSLHLIDGRDGEPISLDALKTHITHLRRKIEQNREIPQVIVPYQGLGYRLVDHFTFQVE